MAATAAQDSKDAEKVTVAVEERRGFRIQPRTYFLLFGGRHRGARQLETSPDQAAVGVGGDREGQ